MPNPFITHLFTADPSAHVWDDGRLWVYPSHDRDDAKWFDMTDWHVFSSADLEQWTDHGPCLTLDDVPYARAFAWAPDCAYRNGTYYYYFPVSDDPAFGNTNRIGVGTSKDPAGPFTPSPEPLVVGYPQGFDPAVFIDDDGTAYLYSGQNTAFVAKLAPSMTELDGSLRVIDGANEFFEGIWMYKRAGRYYLMYSTGQHLKYAMGTSPFGPFEFKGVLLEPTGCSTTHGSIVDFRGETLLFYHTKALSGDDFKRSICFDRIHFNADGTLKPVERS